MQGEKGQAFVVGGRAHRRRGQRPRPRPPLCMWPAAGWLGSGPPALPPGGVGKRGGVPSAGSGVKRQQRADEVVLVPLDAALAQAAGAGGAVVRLHVVLVRHLHARVGVEEGGSEHRNWTAPSYKGQGSRARQLRMATTCATELWPPDHHHASGTIMPATAAIQGLAEAGSARQHCTAVNIGQLPPRTHLPGAAADFADL